MIPARWKDIATVGAFDTVVSKWSARREMQDSDSAFGELLGEVAFDLPEHRNDGRQCRTPKPEIRKSIVSVVQGRTMMVEIDNKEAANGAVVVFNKVYYRCSENELEIQGWRP